MKKLFLTTLSAVLIAFFAIPAVAIVLAPDAGNNVPSVYAKVKDGKILYDKQPTAYSSITFNQILEAYGLKLTSENVSGVPPSYAKVVDNNIKFNKVSIAYEPVNYHAIFTSYGLELSPEEVGAKLGAINYAKVVDGKIVFAKGSIAYSGAEMATILSAYNLPAGTVAEAMPVQSSPADADKDGVPDAQDKCPGTPAGAVIDERGCWVLSASYLFDFDKAVIRTEYYPLLDDVVKIMNDNPTLTIEIQGHACNIGTDTYNQGLSERRANAVRDYLTKKNVDALRITTVGFGEEKPAHSNDNEEGRAKNRRIEFMPIW